MHERGSGQGSHGAPALPQWSRVSPLRQTPLSQHPLQLTASHTHSPSTHRVPGPQRMHTWPSRPQASSLSSSTQLPSLLRQQPNAQYPEHPTHWSSTHRSSVRHRVHRLPTGPQNRSLSRPRQVWRVRQQVSGQLTASHRHSPSTHRVPWPHERQRRPSAPQASFAVPARQMDVCPPPVQQPGHSSAPGRHARASTASLRDWTSNPPASVTANPLISRLRDVEPSFRVRSSNR
jgi:hypothetical protein